MLDNTPERLEATRLLLGCCHKATWDRYPYMPLTRPKTGDPFGEAGVIYKYELGSVVNGVTIVRIVNVFLLPDTYEEYKQLTGIAYASIDDLIDAGWRVD